MTTHDYYINCTIQEPPGKPPEHARIVAVGFEGMTDTYTLATVLTLMDQNHRMWVRDASGGAAAKVVECKCNGTRHITTEKDGRRTNNLDNLPYCPVRR